MEAQQLGPYVLMTRLGRGGMGAVYEAEHQETGEHVAVKVLASHLADDLGLKARFDSEIQTLKPLRSPGIVQLIAYGEDDGQPYFAMELVHGQSLERIIRGGRIFTPEEVVDLSIEIARSLKVAHDHGIIHRDLKPANLLVPDDPHQANAGVKLADFGIAKLFGATSQTAHGSIVGTAEFMAPEQAAGKPLDARADLYTLGLVMFTMIAGKPPFRGSQLTEIITKQLRDMRVLYPTTFHGSLTSPSTRRISRCARRWRPRSSPPRSRRRLPSPRARSPSPRTRPSTRAPSSAPSPPPPSRARTRGSASGRARAAGSSCTPWRRRR